MVQEKNITKREKSLFREKEKPQSFRDKERRPTIKEIEEQDFVEAGQSNDLTIYAKRLDSMLLMYIIKDGIILNNQDPIAVSEEFVFLSSETLAILKKLSRKRIWKVEKQI